MELLERPGRTTLFAIAVAACFAGSTASAQRLAPSLAQRSAFRTLPQQVVDEKIPGMAGLLSVILPGLGSFYAGNPVHGLTHLVIHVASFAVFAGGVLIGNEGAFLAGVGTLVVNYVWSILTAVHDADSYNAQARLKPGRVSETKTPPASAGGVLVLGH